MKPWRVGPLMTSRNTEETFSKMGRKQLYEKCKENTLWFISAGQYKPPSTKDRIIQKLQDQVNFVRSKIPYVN